MASLANQTISSTYDGLIKTSSDNAVPVSGVQALEDGSGNALALSVGRSGNGVTVSGNLAVDTNTLYVDAASDSVSINDNVTANVPLTVTTNSGYEDVLYLKSSGTNIDSRISMFPTGTGNAVINAATNSLEFQTAGSERMRIDSSGNLLVGTTNADVGGSVTGFKVGQNGQVYSSTDSTTFGVQPLYLDRRGTNNTGDSIMFAMGGFLKSSIGVLGTNSIANDGGITFNTISANTTKTERMRIDSSGNVKLASTTSQSIDFTYGAGGAAKAGMLIDYSAGEYRNYVGEGGNSYFYSFYTNGSEAMRITSGGDVLIGTTESNSTVSTSTGLKLLGLSQGGTSARIDFRKTYSGAVNATANYHAGTYIGGVVFSNTATSFETTSDYRLKEDLQPIANPLDRVDLLNPVNFAWKTDGSRVDGFIAHEVAEVVPEAISGEKDAVDEEGNPIYQGIDQSKLTPLLTAALKEAHALIKSLEARIEILENK